MAKLSQRTTLRVGELIADVFSSSSVSGEHDAPNKMGDWPRPDYAASAADCAGDPQALDKLRLLCDDLESLVTLGGGPGTLPRLAQAGPRVLEPLAQRCWRDILLDSNLNSAVWTALRNYSRALKSHEMDEPSRRMGIVIHAVAVARLDSLGDIETDPKKRRIHKDEREFICGKKYVPAFIKFILRNLARSY